MRDREGLDEVEQIVANVGAAAKYWRVCPRTVQRLAAEEWARHHHLKRAIKATKSRLHQVYSAYESPVDYDRGTRLLEAAYAVGTPQAVRQACRTILALHTSTRERLPILDRFYADLYAYTGTPRTLLDLACGLNPLSHPWMGLPPGVAYHAYDIDTERIAFLDRYLALAGAEAHAHLQDILCDPPTERADVALLLKSSTCLERQRKGSTLALLDRLDVSHVVVTFPVKSLGQREKGMPEHYQHAFLEMVSGRPWRVTRFAFATELAFIVSKG